MKTSCLRNALLVPTAALSLAGFGLAQGTDAQTTPRGRFVTLPPKPSTEAVNPAVTLPTWNGKFTYKSKTYTFNMVGAAPASNRTTTIPVFIIPLKIVIGTNTFDASHVLTNGQTVVQNTVASPLFDATTTYKQGGVDVGTTQYIDAYQRANFWHAVTASPNYHTMLGTPTVLTEQTLTVPARDGSTGSPFGFKAGEVNINWFDAQIQTIMKSFSQIQPNTLPIFIAYNTYLTQGGCCIGGYHSALGAQAYAFTSYVDVTGAFAQNVSALSHEIGEWMDDPLVNNGGNNSPCGIMENGDPLENNPNFGAFAYTLNGFVYDLQDLVTVEYFGAPAGTSVHNFFTFQGESLTVCQNGS